MVVNYRTKELTRDAARSALSEPEVREVVIVDNDSGDGSAAFLRDALSHEAARIVEAPTNLGFGRAVNLVVPDLRCGLVLLLNSDATLVAGAVAELTAALLADPAVGVVAPVVVEADGMSPQPGTYGTFPRLVPGLDRRHPTPLEPLAPDWVSGVAMLVRKEDFLALGGFDPDLQMYLEDVDLCRRLRDRGQQVRRVTTAVVVHAGGGSWTSEVLKRARYHRSKIVYFRKLDAGRGALAFLHVLRVVRVWGARLGSIRRSSRPRRRSRGSQPS